MNIGELPVYLEGRLQYPIDRRSVIDEIGDISLEAPHEPPDDIASILYRLEEDSYDSADELFTSIVGTVSDRYIGRKFYDDRGTNPGPPLVVDGFEDNESF